MTHQADQVAETGRWLYKRIASFDGGLNDMKPPHEIADNELSSVENLVLLRGRVQADTGYKQFGGSVRGAPRAAFQFFKTNNTSELLLITDATVYKWNQSEWQYIAGDASTTASVGEAAGSTQIDVASEAGFAVNDYVGITLDDGTQHQSQVTAVSVGVLTIADPIPTGRSVPVGAAVVKAVALSGSQDKQVSLITYAPSNWLLFTNGVDAPKRYDGTSCVDLPGLPAGGATVCKALGLFNNHVLLLGTSEGGTDYPQRVRWSDTADPTNWSTGNAGYNDLVSSEDFIVTGAPLGPFFIVYKERSIVRMEYVGSTDRLFNFTDTVAGEGAVSHDGLIDLGDQHIFIGNSNIYLYKGEFSYDALNDRVVNKMFTTSSELNASAKHRSFAIYVEELDEVWAFYAQGSSTWPDRIMRVSLSSDTVWYRKLQHQIAGFGFYQRTTAVTWDELTGTWEQQSWAWDSQALQSNSPTTLLCDPVNNVVYEYDYTTTSDAGQAISWLLETRDFEHSHFKVRLDSVDLLFNGSGVSIEVSLDRGQTWKTLGSGLSNNGLKQTRLWSQQVGDSLRFRLSGQSSGFEMGWLGFEYTLESAW